MRNYMTAELPREALSRFLAPDSDNGDTVFAHGTTDGIYQRTAVWLLGGSDQGGPESAAGLVIQRALLDMGSEAPELLFGAGDVRATLGAVDYPTAHAVAVKGLAALMQSDVAEEGVGVSVKVVTFTE